VGVCICGFGNMWVCVNKVFIICGSVYVCVCVMCGFFNACVCVSFLKCNICNVCVL